MKRALIVIDYKTGMLFQSNETLIVSLIYLQALWYPASRRVRVEGVLNKLVYGDVRNFPGGYSWEFLVGMCLPGLQILTRGGGVSKEICGTVRLPV